jgi:hypothetical protein
MMRLITAVFLAAPLSLAGCEEEAIDAGEYKQKCEYAADGKTEVCTRL